MTAQQLIQKQNVVCAIPDIDYMDIFTASTTHILLRIRFAQQIRFPKLFDQLQFRVKQGRKVRECEVEEVKYNKLGHWEFHLKPKKGKFPFGRKSIFKRKSNFKDQTVEIQILFAENWQSFFPHLY